jgi:hypothetical protein
MSSVKAKGRDLHGQRQGLAADVPDEEVAAGLGLGPGGDLDGGGRNRKAGIGNRNGPGGGLGQEAGLVLCGDVIGDQVAVARRGGDGGHELVGDAGRIGHGDGPQRAAVALPAQGGGGHAIVVGDDGGDRPGCGRRGRRGQRRVLDDGRSRKREGIQRVGMVRGFKLVFIAVAVGIGIAILAQAAVVTHFEPVRQAVGIAVLRRGQVGGGGRARGRHGDRMELAPGGGRSGGMADAVELPAGERERNLVEDVAFRRDQAGGGGILRVPDNGRRARRRATRCGPARPAAATAR